VALLAATPEVGHAHELENGLVFLVARMLPAMVVAKLLSQGGQTLAQQ
jgi:hypothetical protein